jgi:phosphate transport system substrate-binding protein
MGFCADDQMVRVSGALPLSDLVTGWANDYMKSNPNHRVAVMGKTAGYGYAQFLEGKANLVMATRKMTKQEQDQATEKGLHVTDTLVMNIPVAVVTNAKNPLNALTMDQIRDIYAGRISNWKEVGGPDEVIRVLMRPYPATGVAVLFKKQLLKDLDFRKDAVSLSSYKNMVHVCEQSMGIGHMPATGAFCDPKKYGIKILGLKKDAGSPSVLPGQTDYPINMPFYFVWNADKLSPDVEDFIKYAVNRAKSAQRPQ